MRERRRSERRLSAHDRRLEVLRLRKAGKDFREIAAEVGYAGPSGAYQAFEAAMRETLREPADQVRALELERLDAMLRAVWPSALEGELRSIETVLRLMDRRARYLGLDAPTKVDITARVRGWAEELGLDPDQAVAEAEQLLRSGRG
jgi:hypothetical protein